MESYEKLTETQVDVKPIFNDCFIDLLKSVHRRLNTRETKRNNRRTLAVVSIHRSIFFKFYKAVRDWSSSFGRSLVLDKKRNGDIKKITIEFSHKRAFECHMKKVTDTPIKRYLKKSVKNNTIEVVISEDKTASLVFDVARNILTSSMSFIVKNLYGNIC